MALDLLSDLVRAADDIKRVFVENVFVRRLFPLEMLGVEVIRSFYHRDADDHRCKGVAVGDVDLDAAAGFIGPFLEGWAEVTRAERNA